MSDAPDTRPLILFAVKEEAAHFHAANVETVICGMGKQNASAAITRMLSRREPRVVITCGFAGGLNEALQNGDVVGDWDAGFPLSSALENGGVRRVSFHCADRVAVTREEKSLLRKTTGMDVVEMESGVIREICRSKNIPSATVRVVSDSATDELPLDFNQLVNADHTMNFARLAGALVRAPWKIPELIRFSGRVNFAARELGRTLGNVLTDVDSSAKPSETSP
jgi:adenosylhomocysteine nucleosidase